MRSGLWWRIPFTLGALPFVAAICALFASGKWVKEMLVETTPEVPSNPGTQVPRKSQARQPLELFDRDRR